jgi:hypothetical protein
MTAGETVMTLIAIAGVKNEIDVIEAFVRHTLAFADRLIVLDNGSTDGTRDVLTRLCGEGLPLDVVEDPSLGYYQARRMNYLLREYALGRYRADWILPLDADEFVVVSEGCSLVREGAAPARPLSLPWRTYFPDESDDPSQPNPVLRIRQRRRREGWGQVKVLVPRALAALPNMILDQGNHKVLVDGQECEPLRHEGACIAHFPIRTPGQYLAKIVLSCLQHLAMPEKDPLWGQQCRDSFELLKRDLGAFLAGYQEAARRYAVPADAPDDTGSVVDPVAYRGGSLAYTPAVDDAGRGWQAVLHYAEGLAHQQAALLAGLTQENRLSLEQQAAQVATLRAQLDRQIKELNNYRARSEQNEQALRQSWSWRVGRLVVGPASWVKAAWRRDSGARSRSLPRAG